MSDFNPDTFLNATTTDALTRRPPIPAGTELQGILGVPKPRQNQGKKESTMGQVFTSLDIPVEIDLSQNPAIQTLIGTPKVTLQYGFLVDLTPAGTLDTAPGKNGRLRQLRDALGMNKPGEAFNIMSLVGRQIRVKISHRVDERDGEVYDQIDGIAKS